ncbi:MAG TPA: glycosyltransferase family 4 protein [Candidatus Binataceae bacterium]|nr:glycosyltransferase family 4 protein [Candidatus Binataceae bacterium]
MRQSPLRFLHITTFYPPYSFGGDAIYVSRLANALARDGHLVDVIHCIDSYEMLSGNREVKPEPSVHPNLNVFGLRSGFGALSPLLTQQTGAPFLKRAQIDKIVQGKSYDVVQFHNISLIGPEILNLAPNADMIKLYMALEYWLVCPTHMLWKFNERLCESPECITCVLKARRPPQIWRYFGTLQRAAAQVDQFIAPSECAARLHAERGFSAPFEYLPLFTEIDEGQDPRQLSRPHVEPYFLFAGRLEKLKGIDTLISAWERNQGADLLIAGDGTEATSLRARAAGNPRIVFLGSVPQARMKALYAHALACIVPSLFWEPFGLVAIEALANRTPVIAHRIGGPAEIVEQSGGGLLYDSGQELVDALEKIASDSSLRENLAERGYAACRELWSREAHLKMYYELIERTAARKFSALGAAQSI